MSMNWVFGYGSIMNPKSRGEKFVAIRATLEADARYRRHWCFRSSTGFTALGLRCRGPSEPEDAVCGVIFAAGDDIAAFDLREVGYRREPIDLAHLTLLPQNREKNTTDERALHTNLSDLIDRKAACIWVYVPDEHHDFDPSPDAPLVQSYIDTCLSGCNQIGGHDLVSKFILTTGSWSPYYLNDVPMSRRPWLHRPADYRDIDQLLTENNKVTHIAERRHPEDFSSAWLGGLESGLWNIPRRNTHFTARKRELEELKEKLAGGFAALVGMGGVGKTSLAVEYCHRIMIIEEPTALILWLNAASVETLLLDLRAFLADCGVAVSSKQNEEVISAVKTRLSRSRNPWLVIFDNVENGDGVDPMAVVPRTGGGRGRVLVTSRWQNERWREYETQSLSCFDFNESLQFLRASGCQGIDDRADRGAVLCDLLGYLPLALACAASYMRSRDINAATYVQRVQKSTREKALDYFDARLPDYSESVANAISMSLDAVHADDPLARQTLCALAFMHPDAISKRLIAAIVRAMRNGRKITAVNVVGVKKEEDARLSWPAIAASVVMALASMVIARRSRGVSSLAALRSALVGAIVLLASHLLRQHRRPSGILPPAPTGRFSPVPAATATALFEDYWTVGCQDDEAENLPFEDDAERIWEVLKKHSLIVARARGSDQEPQASLHRLVQQAVRSGLREDQVSQVVSHCFGAVRSLWRFDPSSATTWAKSQDLVEHIRCMASFAAQHHCCKPDAARLLTGAAVFHSVVLSRFEQSRQILEQAVLLCDTSVVQLELGKTQRYLGNYVEASDHLWRALDVQRREEGTDSSFRIATILHELGTTENKRQNLPLAEKILLRALDMKQQGKTSRSNKEGKGERRCGDWPRHREVAATLHQLAIVSTHFRPPRLEAAELLLKRALTELSEQESTTGSKGNPSQRASTLQQLGRLATRQGRPVEAYDHFSNALVLHESIHARNDSRNVAVVLNQIGLLALARRPPRAIEAKERLESALRIQRSLHDNRDHLEVACALGACAKAARANGQRCGAKAYLEEERAMLDRLLQSKHCEGSNNGGTTIRPGIADLPGSLKRQFSDLDVDASSTSFEKTATRTSSISSCDSLEKELMNVLWGLRAIAKEEKDDVTAREIGHQVRELKTKWAKSSDNGGDVQGQALGQRKSPEPQGALLTAVLVARMAVREVATGKGKAMNIPQAAANLSEMLEKEDAEDRGGAVAGAARQFCDSIGAAGEDRRVLFEACDTLRENLRDFVSIEDCNSKRK